MNFKLLLSIAAFGLFTGVVAHAEDEILSDGGIDRDPAATSALNAMTTKRTYPGAADEDDIQVQARLPEAALRSDARSVQRGVYKSLYNQELKDEGRDPVEE